jgi:hypothetical protein
MSTKAVGTTVLTSSLYSSLCSVSGTAINLGLHSVNEKGLLHYPKVKNIQLRGVRVRC